MQDLVGGLHSHTFHFFKREFLTPFALWLALPTAMGGHDATDYYGVSVAIGLAPRRRSRSAVIKDVIGMT